MTDLGKLGLMLPFSIAVSALGFFIIIALALYGTGPAEVATWRKPIVGSIFALMCFLGIVLAVSPRKCSETFGHQRRIDTTASSSQISKVSYATKGHHYDCGRFSGHTIRIDGHILCAACTGLLLGGLGALFGSALCFFIGWELPRVGFLAVLIGVTAMILGFLQLKLRGFARLILNMIFVLGAFLILAGMDELDGSLIVDLFSIVLIAFWLFTRILFSQWDHWRICRTCLIPCETSGKRKDRSISSAHSVKGADHY
jgi:hypothetical protein